METKKTIKKTKPEKLDIHKIEKKWQEYWQKEKIYVFNAKSKKKVFSIDTPPPYISGRPHIGHAYAYALFDIIARFKRMKGFSVFLPIGFDDNGHPTERYVEKKHNIKSTDISREKFIELCRKETGLLEKTAKKDLISFGCSFDWNLFYSTINDLSIKTAQHSFIDLYNKRLVYRSSEPRLWCPYCKTALAQADVEDSERGASLFHIKFNLEDNKNITIATTRPEFLPACVGILVNPSDKRYKNLTGKKATVPLFNQKVEIIPDEKVDPEFGTGIVMVCTFGDKTDIEWWKKHKLPLKLIITKEGKLNELAGKYKGLTLKKAKEEITRELREKNLLEKAEIIRHSVGVCWRCHNPVEFLVTKQWMVKLLEHKDEFINLGKKIIWHPSYMVSRYNDWVSNLSWDWVISRQRHYGVPMPVWYCEKCGKEIIAEEKQIPVNPSKIKLKKRCLCGSTKFRAEKDVFDTWFTSSLTPEIALRWANQGELFEKNFPENLRPQGYEIIRTWAFYTIVKAFYHFKKIPWKSIMVNGMVLDSKGRAIHKSLGNVIDPIKIIEKYSSDALRFFALSSKFGDDISFQEKELVTGQKTIIKLWNAAKFSMQHTSNRKAKKLEAFDLWLLIKLNKLIEECTADFNKYKLSKSRAVIENFFWRVFCDNYLEIIKNRIYQTKETNEKKSAQYTLYRALLVILKVLAPIIPHITEELYNKYFKKIEKTKSIHLSKWPEKNLDLTDKKYKKIETAGDTAIELITKVRRFKTNAQRSLKAEIILTLEKETIRELKDFMQDIKEVTSAKEIKEGKFKIEFL